MKELLTLTGPTASGKTTLEQALVDRGVCRRARSHTTRAMRPGEVNGDNYLFVSREEFTQMLHEDKFVETNEYGGNLYGTSKAELEQDSDVPIVKIVEPVGAANIASWARSQSNLTHLPIYMTNTPEVLAQRFVSRSLADFPKILNDPAKAKDFARRIALMMTAERQWDSAAMAGHDGYSFLSSSCYRLVLHRACDNMDTDIKNIKYLLGMERRKERRTTQ